MGFDIGVCLGLNLDPQGRAMCSVEMGAGPPPVRDTHPREIASCKTTSISLSLSYVSNSELSVSERPICVAGNVFI